MIIKDEFMGRRKFFNLVFLIAVILFSGCGKKGNDGTSSGNYYFKFKVDGKSYTFKGSPYATFNQDNDLYYGGAGAFKDMGVGTKNVASVLIGSLSPLKAGTFTGLISPASGGNTPAVFFSWIDENGKTFGSLYQDNATNTVTITSLTNTSVKGKFSGKIYDVSQTGSAAKSYSGEFYVKRMQ